MADPRQTNQPSRPNDTASGSGASSSPEQSRPGEVTIEIVECRNANSMFAPTRQILRGRWAKANVSSSMMPIELERMPDLPGIHVMLDSRRRLGRIYDPLALPENTELLRRARAAHKSIWSTEPSPDPESLYQDLSDTQCKTWLYWIRRMVDAGQANVVSGSLPAMKDIQRLSGKTGIEHYNSSSRAVKFMEDFNAANSVAMVG